MNGVLTLTKSPSAADLTVVETLKTAGFVERDGWFYPPGDVSRAAVRLSVYNGQYQIWRRRKLNGFWMTITVDDSKDFDPQAFKVWQDSWPLVH